MDTAAAATRAGSLLMRSRAVQGRSPPLAAPFHGRDKEEEGDREWSVPRGAARAHR